jgi:hypothetical protein
MYKYLYHNINEILQAKLSLFKTKHNRSGNRRQTFEMRTISVTNMYQKMVVRTENNTALL